MNRTETILPNRVYLISLFLGISFTEEFLDQLPIGFGADFEAFAVVQDKEGIIFRSVLIIDLSISRTIMRDVNVLRWLRCA